MANYKIFENGVEINTIVADEEFCSAYCADHGYTYELEERTETEAAPTEIEQLRADIDFVAIMTGVTL